MDSVSGILEDFYTEVMLPLGKWVLEKGLPDLLQVFTDFNNKVDWEALRSRLEQFWEHLEPFAEIVGEGLIIFIERISNALADFLNSPEFDNFLTKIENWMDNVKPEDVADAFEKIAKGVIELKVALVAWGALKGAFSLFSTFIELISSVKMAKALKNLAGGAGAASAKGSLFGGISSAISSLGGIKGILTTDLATILGAGTAAEIGVTIGTGILGGLAGAFAGGVIGQLLDNYILGPIISLFDEEQGSYFKDFKWFGEGGLFGFLSTVTWKEHFNALDEMITSYSNSKFIQFLNGDISGLMGKKHKTWKETKEEVLGAITIIKEEAPKIWAGFMNGIDTISDWFTNSVKPWFTVEKWAGLFQNVAVSAAKKWVEIKNWWDSSVSPWVSKAWEMLKNSAKAPINGIISMAETLANGVVKAINSIITALNGLSFDVPDWIPGIGGKSIGFSIPELQQVSIPRLATGAVIPANREFLAVLGDQKHGTNIEAPLDTIRQASEEAVMKVLSQLGFSGNSSPQTIIIKQYLDGKQVAESVVKEGKVQQMSTGKNMFMLGGT